MSVCRGSTGRSFHSRGPATTKLISPTALSVSEGLCKCERPLTGGADVPLVWRVGSRSSDRYGGVKTWRDLYTSTTTLKTQSLPHCRQPVKPPQYRRYVLSPTSSSVHQAILSVWQTFHCLTCVSKICLKLTPKHGGAMSRIWGYCWICLCFQIIARLTVTRTPVKKWIDLCCCSWCWWAPCISTTVCPHSTHSFSCRCFYSKCCTEHDGLFCDMYIHDSTPCLREQHRCLPYRTAYSSLIFANQPINRFQTAFSGTLSKKSAT